MIKGSLPTRGHDDFGSGHFGASRGNRKHNGVDYVCAVGTKIYSPVLGEVTKLGYPYSSHLEYRYVEVTDNDGFRHRLFYCEPDVDLGDIVDTETVIGTAQDIEAKYSDRGQMTNHVHYEIIRALSGTRLYFNPSDRTETI